MTTIHERRLRVIRLLCIAALFLFACTSPAPRAQARPELGAPAPAEVHCTAQGSLPDPTCTPGAAESIDLQTLCTQHMAERRHVTEATKRKVFEMYGIPYPPPGERAGWEVDHLISIELGGSNDLANLWPEPADPAPGYRQKDLIENELHRQVCAGTTTLSDAQHLIATDWLSVWNLMQARRAKP